MQPLFDINSKIIRKEKYPFKCESCSKIFHILGVWLKLSLKTEKIENRYKFCSKDCQSKEQTKTFIDFCKECNSKIVRTPAAKRQSKSGNSFCSRSCSAKFNNKHKKSGNRRSKLEIWLERKLTKQFKKIEIHFNRKDTINSELDIYIPLLKLAFELNGIFHYEPIYGQEKLASIQNNDNRKFQACLEQDIELVIIDSSSLKYFKESNAMKYFKIIKKIINNKIASATEIESVSII